MRKNRSTIIIYVCLAVFFLFCVIVPLLSMLSSISREGLTGVFRSAQFSLAVKNSLLTSLAATAISIPLALAAAFALERSTVRCKAVFEIVFVAPMLIPSISHAFGLVALFGANGLITNLLRLKSSIYGFWGIVIGSVIYSFPVAFLMFESILKYEDGMVYRAAEVLGVPRFRRFTDITLPYLRKTVISAVFAVFTMTVTDYGVPLMIGGKTVTLSTLMYNKAVAMIDYDSGSVIGAVLLIPAVAAFIADLLNPEKSEASFVTEKVTPEKNTVRNTLALLFCILLSVSVVLPILSFCIMVFETKYPVDSTFTLSHIRQVLNRGAGEYALNSLFYSVITAAVGTFLAFCCSYLTARKKGPAAKALHLASITSMAIPGIVLGLSYVIFFHGSAIYGTVLIVILVNSVHFFASPYLMMYNTMQKINPNLENVGATLGIKPLYLIKDVIVPKVKYTLYEMAVYFFVNSMMTISAVAFLAPPSPKSVALMINQFEAQRLMEGAAFVSLLILIINIAAKTAVTLLSRRRLDT